jgi:hypothetical protein
MSHFDFEFSIRLSRAIAEAAAQENGKERRMLCELVLEELRRQLQDETKLRARLKNSTNGGD